MEPPPQPPTRKRKRSKKTLTQAQSRQDNPFYNSYLTGTSNNTTNTAQASTYKTQTYQTERYQQHRHPVQPEQWPGRHSLFHNPHLPNRVGLPPPQVTRLPANDQPHTQILNPLTGLVTLLPLTTNNLPGPLEFAPLNNLSRTETGRRDSSEKNNTEDSSGSTPR
ncbi:hypothetical protein VTL71DRAFT_13803 [Oculimacula yallundae]|uniref:Uncharacterized protein n=1 Tax=Oculimacula yallundae TaxID=86028 RepID=A0ABR4CLE5_9HELO